MCMNLQLDALAKHAVGGHLQALVPQCDALVPLLLCLLHELQMLLFDHSNPMNKHYRQPAILIQGFAPADNQSRWKQKGICIDCMIP